MSLDWIGASVLVMKKHASKEFPQSILELPVPHAVDEGVQSCRKDCIHNSHHQIQGLRGDGGGL